MAKQPSTFSERELEEHIVDSMVRMGYIQGASNDFDKRFAIDKVLFWQFLQDTQQDELDKIIKFSPNDWQDKILNRLDRVIKKNGILHILKHGLSVDDAAFNLLYPAPLASSSQKVKDNYQTNLFSITRQVYYSADEPRKSIDLVLFINGLALITFELKSTHKSQTARFNALKQYQNDRDPKEPLFNFARCAVHFALDNQEVYMTTRLAAAKTFFLPFNKGNNGGSGNPLNPNGFKTAYLWQEVLAQDSLVNLLSHFVRLGCDDPDIKNPKLNDKTLYFPRYHQMNVVRRLMTDVQEHGVGKRYLIQHSAGSGKSNSITWLAYQLIEAYQNPNNDTAINATEIQKPLYDSVIVVTDRRLLDKQIRDNINQFSEVKGIIAHAERSSDLRDALESGKKIIITTIFKFPWILDEISEMADKKFAILIDEAHSSQGGSVSDDMNKALGVKDESDTDNSNDDGEIEDNQDKINKAIEARKMQGHVSYFGFTATPKDSTLEKFGIKQTDGSFEPFDLYSMKQAIQEGFILDVISNYTTFKSYYQIQKTIKDDPKFDTNKAQKALKAYVEHTEQTINTKAAIMLDHFMDNIYGKNRLNGHAKGMVVTQNIPMAIRYYQALTKHLKEKGNPFKILIAFSGSKKVDGIEYTEPTMNGFEESKTKDKFDTDEYRLLVVANKYLTGFDQPKLTAMYVDKKLKGVQAVQTLSRLNRSAPKYGKKTEDLFVLDFYNTTSDIKAAFDRYYTATTLSEATDINVLHEIKDNLDSKGVYEAHEVIEYADLFFGNEPMEVLEPKIDVFADRFNDTLNLADETKIEFKMQAKQFVKLYGRIAAIIPFNMVDWERLYWVLKPLIPKLNVQTTEDKALDELLESVNLNTYAIERTALGQKITLTDDAGELTPSNSNPIGVYDPETTEDVLDKIIEDFNKHWFENWHATPEEQRFKLINLVKRIQEHRDFDYKYNNIEDEQTRNMEFANMVREIVVSDRRKEVDFYKKFVGDENFQMAFMHSLRMLVDREAGEKR
ncbi:type I restriction endonuclease subunit R [Psychrobacter celer]|uniref:type I restriction endonuclease subunit R n=1 Tax=Psychrobacter celer TaxID=306572 RepID=UPI003FD28383